MSPATLDQTRPSHREHVLGSCRLCQQTRELRGSHILPEFLYKPAYDPKHRAKQLTANAGRESWIQKGYREELLCDACEGQFSRYEQYFAQNWLKGGKRPAIAPASVFTVPGLDYKAFRLFHLSVLWRASVSALPFFRNVTLGPHEERIRLLLIAEDPGTPDTYPFWARVLIDPASNRIHDDIIVDPERAKPDGHTCYIFTYGGCVWYYFVSSHPKDHLLPVKLTPTGDFTVGTLSFLEHASLVDTFVKFAQNRDANQAKARR